MINKKKAAILVGVLTILAIAAIIILFKGQAAAQVVSSQARPSRPAPPDPSPGPSRPSSASPCPISPCPSTRAGH